MNIASDITEPSPAQPRFRFNLQSALVVMVLLSSVLGLVGKGIENRRRNRAAQPELYRREQVTTEAYGKARQQLREIVDSERGTISHSRHIFLTARSGWRERFTVVKGSSIGDSKRRDVVFDVEVEAFCSNGVFETITIRDYGGSENQLLIELLSKAYQARKWAHRVVPGSPPTDDP